MRMNSLWKEYEIREREPLFGDTKTDILIIGGGIAGILLARELEDREPTVFWSKEKE